MISAQYDDPEFFSRYRQIRVQRSGLNEDLDQSALDRVLGEVAGADVMDIGCGDGDGAVARFLARHGARHVLGIGLSCRMLASAASRRSPRIHYCRVSASTDRPPEKDPPMRAPRRRPTGTEA